MTYNQLWRQLTPLYDDREAQAIMRMVLEVAFGLSTVDLYMGKVSELSADSLLKLEEIMRRLLDSEPVQYVLGQADFCGHTFKVCPGVLIPRPETQQLLSMIAPAADSPFTLLDIGTGSGCIAITAALDHPQAHVAAWDLSPAALEIARANAQRFQAQVDWGLQDALHPPHDVDRWDFIVSNPPYICLNERPKMADNVTHYEPEMALYVPDDDPLRFYRAIAGYACHALRPQGRLLFEINPLYAAPLQQMLLQMGFVHVAAIEDIFGKLRFMTAVSAKEAIPL